jgi:hypothetical protein
VAFTDRSTFAPDAAGTDENGTVPRGDDGHGCVLLVGAALVVEAAGPDDVDEGLVVLDAAGTDEPGVLDVVSAFPPLLLHAANASTANSPQPA